MVAVVDGNMGPRETPAFLAELKPDICVVSHYHIDHSRWAAEAAAVPDVTLYVPEKEWPYLADIDHFIKCCGLPDPAIAEEWRAWLTHTAGLKSVPEATPLAPGKTLDFGRTRLEVIAAPGHSPGHQVYWEPEERILFCVDIGVDAFGPWYGWRDVDLMEYVRSIRRVAALDARVLATSHGGVVDRDIRASLLRCLDVLRARETEVVRDLDAGLSADECATRGHIYGDFSRFPRPLNIMYAFWERVMIGEHVRILSHGGVDGIE